MITSSGPLLVLGVGNVLLGDDGLGVHLLHELEHLAERGDGMLPAETRLVDGGTRGAALLPLLAGARALLVLDAVDLRMAPGAVAVLRGDDLRRSAGLPPALGRGGVGDLLAAARLADLLPGPVALVGIQPAAVELGLALSDVVRAALPAAVTAAGDELRRLDADARAATTAPAMACELTGSAA